MESHFSFFISIPATLFFVIHQHILVLWLCFQLYAVHSRAYSMMNDYSSHHQWAFVNVRDKKQFG